MDWQQIIDTISTKAFNVVNFGCRVNAAETNQYAQHLLDRGLTPAAPNQTPGVIIVNTCAITAKGEYESIARIRTLSSQYPDSAIIATGCADLQKISHLPNLTILPLSTKEKFSASHLAYTTRVGDKLSHSRRFLLKIQSGCTHGCSYCIIPRKRTTHWSLPIKQAVKIVNQAIADGYREVIITGINLTQYQYSLNSLLQTLLVQTTIPKISFGSLPLLCIDDKFISLFTDYQLRFTNFLHIPLQSGSDKILKLMNRPYTVNKIKTTFSRLSPLVKGGTKGGLIFGTDIIVGFPGETDADFNQTYSLCQKIGFAKIHVFRYSPRPNTPAILIDQPKVDSKTKKQRSTLLRSLNLKS